MRSEGPGHRLREIRERMRLTLRDVEELSRRIAQEREDPGYVFTAGRLSQVENTHTLPSAYKLATLSEIYRTPYAELPRLYGVDTPREPKSPDPQDPTEAEIEPNEDNSNSEPNPTPDRSAS
jgi:transcriptional regulator with XRE-family HTH domain